MTNLGEERFIWSWSRLAKDFLIIIGVTFVFIYCYSAIAYGLPAWNRLLLPFLNALFQGAPLYVAFILGIRFLRSPIAYLVLSVVLLGWNIAQNVLEAQRIALTLRVFGADMYRAGDITSIGIVHAFVSQPAFAAVLFASYLAVKQWRTSRIAASRFLSDESGS